MDEVPIDTEQPIQKYALFKKFLPIILLFVFAVVVLIILSKKKSKPRSYVAIADSDSESDDNSSDASSIDVPSSDYDLYSEIKDFIARQTDYVMNN
jgi:hypothetical protein